MFPFKVTKGYSLKKFRGFRGDKGGDLGVIIKNHFLKHFVKSVRETARAQMTLQSEKWLRLQKLTPA